MLVSQRVMPDSELTRSATAGVLRAWPQVEREPRRDLIADLRREKPKRHLNQHRVDEYG